MELKNDAKLYVQIDYPVEGKEFDQQVYEEAVAFVNTMAKERYCKVGVFTNVHGAMGIFEAESLEEAHAIAQSGPLIKHGLYRYELYEWQVVITSETTCSLA
ncbi:MAG: hypothetical protein FWC73_07685 [Defluviitaleaceae bacterium]|nr:hypothetical protein [Defluviitaleaceae bacterium]